LENFWSLLKRAIRGTYVNVEPFHQVSDEEVQNPIPVQEFIYVLEEFRQRRAG